MSAIPAKPPQHIGSAAAVANIRAENAKRAHLWRKGIPPTPLQQLKGPDHLLASALPDGFPPELAYRALAAYSLLRTLSNQLRLSPFTPNVFLRALALPCPNRLIGQVHVCLLRTLFPCLDLGYSYKPRGGRNTPKGRRAEDEQTTLRAGDNLTYLDNFTWPVFYDDYVNLTAEILWSAMNEADLNVDMRNIALRPMVLDVVEEESRSTSQDASALDQAGSVSGGRRGRGRSLLPTRRNKTLIDTISQQKVRNRRPEDSDSENESDGDANADEDESDFDDGQLENDDDDDDEEFTVSMSKTKQLRKRKKTLAATVPVILPHHAMNHPPTEPQSTWPISNPLAGTSMTLAQQHHQKALPGSRVLDATYAYNHQQQASHIPNQMEPMPYQTHAPQQANGSRQSSVSSPGSRVFEVKEVKATLPFFAGRNSDEPPMKKAAVLQPPIGPSCRVFPNSASLPSTATHEHPVLQQQPTISQPSVPNMTTPNLSAASYTADATRVYNGKPQGSISSKTQNPMPMKPIQQLGKLQQSFSNATTPNKCPGPSGNAPENNTPSVHREISMLPTKAPSFPNATGNLPTNMANQPQPIISLTKVASAAASNRITAGAPNNTTPVVQTVFPVLLTKSQVQSHHSTPSSVPVGAIHPLHTVGQKQPAIPQPIVSNATAPEERAEFDSAASVHLEKEEEKEFDDNNNEEGERIRGGGGDSSLSENAGSSDTFVSTARKNTGGTQSSDATTRKPSLLKHPPSNKRPIPFSLVRKGPSSRPMHMPRPLPKTKTSFARPLPNQARQIPTERIELPQNQASWNQAPASFHHLNNYGIRCASPSANDQREPNAGEYEVESSIADMLQNFVSGKHQPKSQNMTTQGKPTVAAAMFQSAAGTESSTIVGGPSGRSLEQPLRRSLSALNQPGEKDHFLTNLDHSDAACRPNDLSTSAVDGFQNKFPNFNTATKVESKILTDKVSEGINTGVSRASGENLRDATDDVQIGDINKGVDRLNGTLGITIESPEKSTVRDQIEKENELNESTDDAATGSISPCGNKDDTNEKWPHFEPIEYLRRGVPYHRLPLEQKLNILEFLLDELLTVDAISAEFTRRNALKACFSTPYGALPSDIELGNLENNDECGVCGVEGDLLCCDGCLSSYHRHCINLAIGSNLPEGKWLCPDCKTIDPVKLGPLRGGKKDMLDWFTLDDINEATRMKAAMARSEPLPGIPVILNDAHNSLQPEKVGNSSMLLAYGATLEHSGIDKLKYDMASIPKQPIGNEVLETSPILAQAAKVVSEEHDVTKTMDISSSINETQIVKASQEAPLPSIEMTVLSSDVANDSGCGGTKEHSESNTQMSIVNRAENAYSLDTSVLITDKDLSDAEFLVIHGFVFKRKRTFNYKVRDDASHLKNEAVAGNDLEAMRITPLTQLEVYELLVKIGPNLCSKWPLMQIPRNPQIIWQSKELVDQKVIYDQYFFSAESYDPLHYQSRFRMAPLLAGKKQCPGSGLSYLVNSDYETECATAYTSLLATAMTRNMSFDSSLAIEMKTGTSLYNPYQLFISYMVKLERSLNSACLLNEMWGFRNQKCKQSVWVKNVEKCRSLRRLALLLVRLLDNVHSRAFSEDWHKLPGHTSGKSEPETDQRNYVPLQSDWTPDGEMKRRKFERSSYSNIRGLLASESSSLDGVLGGGKDEMTAKGSNRRKRKQDMLALKADEALMPATSSSIVDETKGLPQRLDEHIALSHPGDMAETVPSGGAISEEKIKAYSSLLRSVIHQPVEIGSVGVDQVPCNVAGKELAATDRGETNLSVMSTPVTPSLVKGNANQTNVKANNSGMLSEPVSCSTGEAEKQLTPTDTAKGGGVHKSDNEIISEIEGARPRRSRRSGRLQKRTDVHEKIGSLVTGAVEPSTARNIHKYSVGGSTVNVGMGALITAERNKKIVQLEELLKVPHQRDILWPMAGRRLFEPEGSLSSREMRRLGRNAGALVAPHLTYNSSYEVGQAALWHQWRNKTLKCKSFEELLLQIRILESHLNQSFINASEHLARRSYKSQVQKVVRCTQRDLETGMTNYFLVNKGKHRGCWVTEESIDSSALILELATRRDAQRKKFHVRLERKLKEEAAKRQPMPKKREYAQTPNMPSSGLVGPGHPAVNMAALNRMQVEVKKVTAMMEMTLVQHQMDIGRLLSEYRGVGLSSLPSSRINAVRSKHMQELKRLNYALKKFGGLPVGDKGLGEKLIGAEMAAFQIHQRTPQTLVQGKKQKIQAAKATKNAKATPKSRKKTNTKSPAFTNIPATGNFPAGGIQQAQAIQQHAIQQNMMQQHVMQQHTMYQTPNSLPMDQLLQPQANAVAANQHGVTTSAMNPGAAQLFQLQSLQPQQPSAFGGQHFSQGQPLLSHNAVLQLMQGNMGNGLPLLAPRFQVGGLNNMTQPMPNANPMAPAPPLQGVTLNGTLYGAHQPPNLGVGGIPIAPPLQEVNLNGTVYGAHQQPNLGVGGLPASNPYFVPQSSHQAELGIKGSIPLVQTPSPYPNRLPMNMETSSQPSSKHTANATDVYAAMDFEPTSIKEIIENETDTDQWMR